MLLAGDIGGTKTNLAIYSGEADIRTPVREASFPSGGYPSLSAIVREFLRGEDYRIEGASFGVAGPVVDGKAKITNLPWAIDQIELREDLGIPSVTLLNDLESIAHALSHLGPDDLHTINAGQPAGGGTLAVVAPGTGLGEAFAVWDGTRYRPSASEGGHADFAPASALEIEMLRYLQARFDHVSYERVCSGIGLPNIYHFLRDAGIAPEPEWLKMRLADVRDPAPVIVQAALDERTPCEICTRTLEIFVSVLGAEAGNLALKVLATGGIYLGGGIPPRILPLLNSTRFMSAFTRKGRLGEVLEPMPVHVIVNTRVPLLGAAYHGLLLS